MTTDRKTIVYIDAENFLHRVIDTGLVKISPNRKELSRFKIRELMEQILDTSNEQLEIRYYTTKLRLAGLPDDVQARLRLMAEFNSNFIPCLIDQNVQVIRAGILRARQTDPCPRCRLSVPYFVEKGVDVRLGVDLVQDAHQDSIKNLVIVSSDFDLLPAIDAAKELGKHVVYVAYSELLNVAMSASVHETVTFSKHQLKQALG
jgi:uncharacterized LabA/DUF88 family protein